MTPVQTEPQTVPPVTKILLGVVLPVGLLILFDVVLLGSVAGKGEPLGVAGMALMGPSFIIVPIIIIVNTVLMLRSSRTAAGVLLAGFAAPTVVAIGEFLFLYGS